MLLVDVEIGLLGIAEGDGGGLGVQGLEPLVAPADLMGIEIGDSPSMVTDSDSL
ncbi:MAG: hypothetical protein ACRDSI_06180 [Pseudonocardiaceae bacterium]